MVSRRERSGVYAKVKADILAQIGSGQLKEGDKLPSERELCQFHQVSRVSIRRAIAELVLSGVLETIPGKGTFVKKRMLRPRHRMGTIALIRCIRPGRPSSVTSDVFYPTIFSGIEAVAAARNVHCIVLSLNEDSPDQAHLDQLAEKIDGVICGELRDEGTRRRIVTAGLPVVLVSPSVAAPGVDVVEVDNAGGALAGVRHLIELGHRRIAFIGGPPASLPSQQRQSGYQRALEEAGIAAHESLQRTPGWRLEDGYQAMKELLDQVPELTAVFAASDLLALGACQAAREVGLRIGADLSVLGFDDIQLAGESRPALSTVRVRRKEIGETAARLLFEQIDGKREYPLRVIVPTPLVRGTRPGPSISPRQALCESNCRMSGDLWGRDLPLGGCGQIKNQS